MSTSTIRRWIETGRLEAFRLEDDIGVSSDEVDSVPSSCLLEYLRAHHRPTDVAKIEREDVQGFITHLLGHPLTATVHNRFRALRRCSTTAPMGETSAPLRREGLSIIDRSPMRRMPPPVMRLEIRPLHLALEDAELVAEHQNLNLLGLLGAEGDDDEL